MDAQPRPKYDDGDTPMNNEGCKRLALAVLQQAVSDLSLDTATHDYPAALAFLTSSHRDWSRQRDFWASCAGMDPDALSEHALKLVRQNLGAPSLARGTRAALQHDVWG